MKFFPFLFFAFPALGFAQGPLVPPGVPAPTMKTLDQIEPRVPVSALPFTISSSGSYYLTGNLSGTAGNVGITIDADNVTLDLGGFELVGNGGTHGIRVINSHVNATISNGAIRDWSGSGFSVSVAASSGMRVERLHVSGCTGGGILLGANGTATGCHVRGNTGGGISGGDACKVIDCTAISQLGASGTGIKLGSHAVVSASVASGNFLNGIEVVRAGSIQNCSSSGNLGAGIVGGDTVSISNCAAYGNSSFGIGAENGGSITACTVSGNSGAGIATLDSSSIVDSSVFSNLGGGISAGNAVTIRGCTLQTNSGGNGISTLDGGLISHCNVRGSTHNAATSAGISTGAESRVSDCLVTDTASTASPSTGSTGAGIITGAGSAVESCVTRTNEGDGIRLTNRSRIIGNNCSGNGNSGDGAGIHTTGVGNHIQGNTVSDNDRGIDVDAADSFIIQNAAYDNTVNFSFVANNRYGPVVNISASSSTLVEGAGTVASGIGVTDPYVNLSY